MPLLRFTRSLGGGAVVPRAKYTVLGGNRLVVAGLLSWLGLSQETEPDHDLIVTIKRGMLAAQVDSILKYIAGDPNRIAVCCCFMSSLLSESILIGYLKVLRWNLKLMIRRILDILYEVDIHVLL